MRYVDLSHSVRSGMPVYPGDPEVTFRTALSIPADGVAVERLEMGSHTGTHLDAPAHSIVGGRTADEIALELLWGEACVVRIAAARAGTMITAADAPDLPARLPRIVCIATGWDAHFGAPEGLTHPYLNRGFAELLWERGARVLCVDMLSPDATESESKPAGMPVHEFWLGNDGVIVENLRGLAEVPDQIELSVLPLRLDGIDGSPVRAVARFDDVGA